VAAGKTHCQPHSRSAFGYLRASAPGSGARPNPQARPQSCCRPTRDVNLRLRGYGPDRTGVRKGTLSMGTERVSKSTSRLWITRYAEREREYCYEEGCFRGASRLKSNRLRSLLKSIMGGLAMHPIGWCRFPLGVCGRNSGNMCGAVASGSSSTATPSQPRCGSTGRSRRLPAWAASKTMRGARRLLPTAAGNRSDALCGEKHSTEWPCCGLC
jgi:hypothetical protein